MRGRPLCRARDAQHKRNKARREALTMMDWSILHTYTAAWQWPFLFVLSIVVDAVWARWAQHAAAGDRWWASIYSVGIILLGAVSVIFYIDDHWLLIPIAVGSFVGTFIGVRKAPE